MSITRAVIGEADLLALMRGKHIDVNVPTPMGPIFIQLLLKDIGFMRMAQLLERAAKESEG